MDPRTTSSGRAADRRSRTGRPRRRPLAAVRRPGLYLGMVTAGAVVANVLLGGDPAAQAEAGVPQSVSVARQLGLTGEGAPPAAPVEPDAQQIVEPLHDLAASRDTREAEQTAAAQAQAAADQAELDRQTAEAEAARAAEEAAAAAAAEEAAARAAEEAADDAPAGAPASRQAAAPAPSGSVAATAVARISNSAGKVKAPAQAAADAVVSNVPGADGITIGGTRPSAADPGGHPSGLALDYMVAPALGDAIAEYHIAHWDELGVEYVIWQQRMLSSPGGAWKPMSDRGSATANHMDHVHVNYRG
ncbi:hypothetical protein OF117_08075 [Geodermatophilus sp. YIM 151500]|uniref:hypothetical protein n=1 Tax=Geodermatophilus sp. YIM 151500 TaxID=2984531 RepID=UPI0021E3A8B9|nr:hypothetical protein [Geodermatophilus sp. YIM 151500]MCV2489321.1 hypothetical protein [Geodermatophilus sp. YIM 151500]